MMAETDVFISQVDFLHRTEGDFFLDTGVIDEMIQNWLTMKFDPHLALFKIMLGLSKIPHFHGTSSQVYDHLLIHFR